MERVQPTPDQAGSPEHIVAPSLRAAFEWLTPEPFIDDAGEAEAADDESKALEIGNIYSYALAEGVPEEIIDQIYAEALALVEQGHA